MSQSPGVYGGLPVDEVTSVELIHLAMHGSRLIFSEEE